jgi:hypothetical protein
MKDMLANLPQYQEQREKVRRFFPIIYSFNVGQLSPVLVTSKYGSGMHGNI